MKKNWPLLVIAIVGVVLGMFWGERQRSTTPAVSAQTNTGTNLTHLPNFKLPNPGGQLLDSTTWNNKVLVVNFWATWCPPCREETPLFVRLQKEFTDRDVQFIGIAFDEALPVQAFISEFSVNYPIMIGNENTAALSKQLGNRHGGLPFTVIADPQGKIVATHTGELLEPKLRSLLEQLTTAPENPAIASKTERQ